MKILNFGSINIDYVYIVDHIVKEGETISSRNLKTFFGGKGFNQSLAISRAGVDVYHFGQVGKDGLEAKETLFKNGVNVDYIDLCEEDRTGNAIIQKDDLGNNCIILYPGANRKIPIERVKEVISKFDRDDFIVLQNEVNYVPEIVKLAKEKGMIIFFNPSPLDEKVFEVPLDLIDYFILNEIEAMGLLKENYKDNFLEEEIAEKLIKKFPNSKFVLTLGEKGSIYIDKNTKIFQDIYKVETLDTTAAGDTFTGYFIAGISKNKRIKEVMNKSSIASAIAVTKLGAEPSIPRIKEIEYFNKEDNRGEKNYLRC